MKNVHIFCKKVSLNKVAKNWKKYSDLKKVHYKLKKFTRKLAKSENKYADLEKVHALKKEKKKTGKRI